MNLRRLQLSFRRQNGDMIFRKQNSHDLLKPKTACGTDSALDGMFKAGVGTVQLRRDSPTNNDVDESIVAEFWDGFGEVSVSWIIYALMASLWLRSVGARVLLKATRPHSTNQALTEGTCIIWRYVVLWQQSVGAQQYNAMIQTCHS